MKQSTIFAVLDIAFMAVLSSFVMLAFLLLGIPVWYALPWCAWQAYRWFFKLR